MKPAHLPVTEAESVVLSALWRRGPLSFASLIEAVKADQPWADATIKTLLHRLMQKGAVKSVKEDGRQRYHALVDRESYVAGEVIKLMVGKGINPVHARVLVLGLAFKENCPDLRNTRVVDIVGALHGYSVEVDVFDPWVDPAQAQHEYALAPIVRPGQGEYDAVIIAVGHDEFRALGAGGIRAFGKPECVVYDVKYVLPRECVDGRL